MAPAYPALATSIGVLATVLIVGLVTVSLLLRTSNRLLQETEEMRQTAFDSANDLRYAIDDMLLALADMPEIETAGFEPVRAKLLQRVNRFYERFSAADLNEPELRRQYSKLLLNMARLRSRLGDPGGSVEAARRLLTLQSPVESSTPDEIQLRIDLLILLGKELAKSSRDESRELVETAHLLAIDPNAACEDDQQAKIDLAKTLAEVADYFAIVGERTLSRQFIADSTRIWDMVAWDQITEDEIALSYGQTLLAAASANAAAESADDAIGHCNSAIEFFENRVLEVNVSDEVLFALARSHRIMSYLKQKEPASAIPSIVRATGILSELSIRHPVVPKYPLTLMDIEYSRGLVLHLDKQHDMAAAVFEDNIEFGEELATRFAADKSRIHARLSDNLTMLGIVRGYQERYEEQLQVLEQSRSLIAKQHEAAGPNNNEIVLTAGADGEIGKCLSRLGRPGEAVTVLRDSIQQLQGVLDRDPDNGQARRFKTNNLVILANTFALLKRWEDAIGALTESSANIENGLPDVNQDSVATWQMELGNWEASLEAAEAFQRYCLDKKIAPERAANLASRLLEITDTLVDRNEIDGEMAAAVTQRVALMGVDAVSQMAELAEGQESVLDEVDDSKELARLRKTSAFGIWRRSR